MAEERDYYKEFRAELTALINKHCCEAESNTPDFILAQYLEDCLKAFDTAVEAREAWYEKPLPMAYQPTKVNCPDCGQILVTDDGVDDEGMPLGNMYCVHCNKTFGQATDVRPVDED